MGFPTNKTSSGSNVVIFSWFLINLIIGSNEVIVRWNEYHGERAGLIRELLVEEQELPAGSPRRGDIFSEIRIVLQETGIRHAQMIKPMIISQNGIGDEIDTNVRNRMLMQQFNQGIIEMKNFGGDFVDRLKSIAAEWKSRSTGSLDPTMDTEKEETHQDLEDKISDLIKDPAFPQEWRSTASLGYKPIFKKKDNDFIITDKIKLRPGQESDFTPILHELREKLWGIPEGMADEIRLRFAEYKEREGVKLLAIHPLATRTARSFPHMYLLLISILVGANVHAGGISFFVYIILLLYSNLALVLAIFGSIIVGIITLRSAQWAKQNMYDTNHSVAKENINKTIQLAATLLRYVSFAFRTLAIGLSIWLFVQGWLLGGSAVQLAGLGVVILFPALLELGWIVGPRINGIISKYSENKERIDKTTTPLMKKLFTKLNNKSFFKNTKPISIMALSFVYHYRPQVASGSKWGKLGALVFYWGSFITTMILGTWIGMLVFQLFFINQFVLGAFTSWAYVRIILAALMVMLNLSLLRTSIGFAWLSAAGMLRKFPIRTLLLVFALIYSFAGAAWGVPIIADVVLSILSTYLIIYEEKIIKVIKNKVIDQYFSDDNRHVVKEFARFIVTKKWFMNFLLWTGLAVPWEDNKPMKKGYVEFSLAIAHGRKARESFGAYEFLAAPIRWAGGAAQQMGDKTMQNISELGLLWVPAKATRAVNSRFFSSARTAVWFIILIGISTIFGFSPFQGIILGLTLLSMVSNQVLTLSGLVAVLESKRFSKIAAIIGAVLFGLIGLIFGFSPYVLIYGALIGGFTQGLSLWIYKRGADIIRFPILLIIYAIGARIFQSPRFQLSGAKADAYKGGTDISEKIKSMKLFKATWLYYGVPMFALFMYTVMFNATLATVLLLSPFLILTVGLVVGPFSHNDVEGRYTRLSKLGTIAGWLSGAGMLWGINSITGAVIGSTGLGAFIPIVLVGLGLIA